MKSGAHDLRISGNGRLRTIFEISSGGRRGKFQTSTGLRPLCSFFATFPCSFMKTSPREELWCSLKHTHRRRVINARAACHSAEEYNATSTIKETQCVLMLLQCNKCCAMLPWNKCNKLLRPQLFSDWRTLASLATLTALATLATLRARILALNSVAWYMKKSSLVESMAMI